MSNPEEIPRGDELYIPQESADLSRKEYTHRLIMRRLSLLGTAVVILAGAYVVGGRLIDRTQSTVTDATKTAHTVGGKLDNATAMGEDIRKACSNINPMMKDVNDAKSLLEKLVPPTTTTTSTSVPG